MVMASRFGRFKAVLLLAAILSTLAVTAPAKACIENFDCPGDPFYDPVPDLPNVQDQVNKVKNKVPVKNAPTALGPVYAIWQATWGKAGGVYTTIPRANPHPPAGTVPVPGQASAQATGCDVDYDPPTSSSCHGWWTQRQDTWRGGACGSNECFRTYWRIVFWTNQNNSSVTHVAVYCQDTGNYMNTEKPCTTGGSAGGYEVPWSTDYYFYRNPFNVCTHVTGELHTHIWVRATVNAAHQVQGTAYRQSSFTIPNSC
jgi:hypothetical protein